MVLFYLLQFPFSTLNMAFKFHIQTEVLLHLLTFLSLCFHNAFKFQALTNALHHLFTLPFPLLLQGFRVSQLDKGRTSPIGVFSPPTFARTFHRWRLTSPIDVSSSSLVTRPSSLTARQRTYFTYWCSFPSALTTSSSCTARGLT